MTHRWRDGAAHLPIIITSSQSREFPVLIVRDIPILREYQILFTYLSNAHSANRSATQFIIEVQITANAIKVST